MITRDEAEQLLERGGHLLTSGGDDLGPVLRIYLDDYSGWPSFCTIPARQADREVFVALHQAHIRPDQTGAEVPYRPDQISWTLTVDRGHDLTIPEEDWLFDYYGVPIEGVSPVVDHLGTVLTPHHPEPDPVDGTTVTAHPVHHPPG